MARKKIKLTIYFLFLITKLFLYKEFKVKTQINKNIVSEYISITNKGIKIKSICTFVFSILWKSLH